MTSKRSPAANSYYKWMCEVVCANPNTATSYNKLLRHLYNTDFYFLIDMDGNRAEDGVSLRYRYAYEHGHKNVQSHGIEGPCSVLEMMVALAIRCEEHIMDDPEIGNRTAQWFWGMIDNLGLRSMDNAHFDKAFVEERLNIFMNRLYEYNGRGGLFTVENPRFDMRTVEIWYQMCWYLNSVLGI